MKTNIYENWKNMSEVDWQFVIFTVESDLKPIYMKRKPRKFISESQTKFISKYEVEYITLEV